MKSAGMSSLRVGVCITLIVVLLQALGVLRGWEYRSIDFRYRNVPRDAQPMTSEIVHVDINDSAINQIGQWPWDRSLLADAIDELRLAGVGAVALDLLLDEPSVKTDEVDPDRILSMSLSPVNAVLAVTLQRDDTSDDWRFDTGPAELNRLLDVLSTDLRMTVDQAMREAGLTGPRRKRFAEQPLLFKRAAAARALQTRDDFTTFAQFESALIPDLSEFIGSYLEQRTLRMAWDQHRAWQSLQISLVGEPSPNRYLDQAPLAELAVSARTVGFVNIERDQHGDGAMREVSILAPAPGGDAVQFGLVAAAAYRGLKPADIVFADDTVAIGAVTLPLHDGKLWLHWPTSETEPRWLGMLRQADTDLDTAGHISIRQLVKMARDRRVVQFNRVKLIDVTSRIVEYAQLPPDDEAELRTEIEFTLADPDEDEVLEPDEAAPDEVAFANHFHHCKLWLDLDGAIVEGEEGLAETSGKLRELVQGKLAFVGWTARSAVADVSPTPVGSRTPGVVIHAAAANMALTGRSVWFMPYWLELVLTALLGVLCTAATVRFSGVVSTIIAVGIVAAYVLVADVWAFRSFGLLAPMAAPMLSGGAIACIALFADFQRVGRRIARQFKARVSPRVVEHLIEHPDRVSMTGEERETTVMFGDFAGFTSISESLGGPATVITLNRYLKALADIVVERDAYLNKFLGDGFMAFWSAFAVDADQAPKACRAAMACQNVIGTLNEDPKYADVPPMALRIGIATGRVVVGDCGAPPDLNDYTVIGDSVNLAARLESANKQFGTDTLIDGNTQSVLDQDEILTRPIGRVIVVGQRKPVDLFTVLSPDKPQSLVDLSAELVAAVKSRRFGDARRSIDSIKGEHGTDRIVEMYDKRLANDAWDGIIRLADK